MFAAFALMAFHAPASPLPAHGTVVINWTVSQQTVTNMTQYPGNGKTNVTGAGTSKATNVTQVYANSFGTGNFNNADILGLLENSLNTTFPAGTQLATDGSDLFVVDHSGTNVIANIAGIVTVGKTNAVTSGKDMTVKTSNKTGTSEKTSGSESGKQAVSVKYDDSALTTKDHTITMFKFYGISVFSEKGGSTTSTNGILTGSFSGQYLITGAGYGYIRGQPSLIQGTILGMPVETYTYDVGTIP